MNVLQQPTTTTRPQVHSPARPEVHEVAITGLKAHNDGPTTLGHTTWLYTTMTTGSNVRFEWDCGDGYTARGTNVRHTYTQPGEYMATVTARNATSTMRATTFVMVCQSDIWCEQRTIPDDEAALIRDVWK